MSRFYSWGQAYPDGDTLDFRGIIRTVPHLSTLHCVNCNEMWCSHTKLAAVRNLDAEFVWDFDRSVYNMHLFNVPMFPSRKLWANALIEMLEGQDYARLHLTGVGQSNGLDGKLSVSYLHPGEGRNVIRTVFIDYMLTRRVIDDKRTCESPTHKYRQEQEWRSNTSEKSGLRVAEFWSVWATGSCIMCRNLNEGSFDSDLVPNDDREKIW